MQIHRQRRPIAFRHRRTYAGGMAASVKAQAWPTHSKGGFDSRIDDDSLADVLVRRFAVENEAD